MKNQGLRVQIPIAPSRRRASQDQCVCGLWGTGTSARMVFLGKLHIPGVPSGEGAGKAPLSTLYLENPGKDHLTTYD